MKQSSKAPNQALKRITIPVTQDIEDVKTKLNKATGVKMTYNQTINYLIHFYLVHTHKPENSEPRTVWRMP